MKPPLTPAEQQQTYRPRPVRCIGIEEIGGLRLKRYELRPDWRPWPLEADWDEALAYASNHLDGLEPLFELEGCGFLIYSIGREADFLLIDLWTGRNMLHHHVAWRPPGQSFTPMPPEGAQMCIWEGGVIDFERRAWINEGMFTNTPNIDSYLRERLAGEV